MRQPAEVQLLCPRSAHAQSVPTPPLCPLHHPVAPAHLKLPNLCPCALQTAYLLLRLHHRSPPLVHSPLLLRLHRQRRRLKARKAEPHLDVLGAVQQPLVQQPRALSLALTDFKVNVGLFRSAGSKESVRKGAEAVSSLMVSMARCAPNVAGDSSGQGLQSCTTGKGRWCRR